MMTALITHEERMKRNDDGKTLYIRKPKNNKGKDKNKNKSKSDKPKCKTCEIYKHTEDKCRFTHPELRPEEWKPTKNKEHLMIDEKVKEEKQESTNSSRICTLRMKIEG